MGLHDAGQVGEFLADLRLAALLQCGGIVRHHGQRRLEAMGEVGGTGARLVDDL
ncbi:hypothetical protein D3C87_2174550 [compost metagenome]